jgi:hypothetical protein
MRLSFSLEKTEKYLVIILICLAIIHLLTWYLHFYTSLEFFNLFRVFDFDEEASIPTLFNTFLFMISTGILFSIGYSMLKQGLPRYRPWLILSAVFLVLTVDEFVSIHESLVEPVRGLLNIEGGVFYLAWVIPGALFLLLIALLFLKWLMGLPGPVKRRIVLAGAIFVIGAIALEMVQGYLTTNLESAYVLRRMVTVLEEFLEMLGLIVFIGALVLYMRSSLLELRFGDEPVRHLDTDGELKQNKGGLRRVS